MLNFSKKQTKSIILVISIIGSAILYASCSNPASGKTATCAVTVTRKFNATNVTNNSTYQLDAVKRAEGTYSIVFVDTEVLNSVSVETANTICTEFDTKIRSLVRTNFATESDVDNNGKIILLLLDIKDGYDPNNNPGYVAGYFDPTDLFSKTTYPVSNEADMIYIDVNPAVIGSTESFSTIAHEFQHLVNFNRTYLTRGFLQDTWINEGLSSGAEYLYQGAQIQSRIDYYNYDPMQTIRLGNNFFVWNGYWEQQVGDVLADYSTVYLFFQWLQLHASNGTGIYKAILDQSYGDYRAVTTAAALKINSTFSSWETLLRTWLLANLIKDTSGYMGYKGAIDVSAWYFDSQGGYQAYLSPGEGIFALTASSPYVPDNYGTSGSNIRYVGISENLTIDTTGPSYDGVITLTFNANSNCNGNDEIGFISNTLTKPTPLLSLFNTGSKTWAMPSKYAISILKSPGGGLQEGSHRPNQLLKGKTIQSLKSRMVKISE